MYPVIYYSPWPLFRSFFALSLPIRFIIGFKNLWAYLYLIIFFVAFSTFLWFKDIDLEDLQGRSSLSEESLIKIRFALFIVREIILFFSFFWCFFHSRLRVTPIIGSWPPIGIQVIPSFRVPLVNTILLLLRGVRLTWAHHRLESNKKTVFISIILTIILGIIFLILQIEEYSTALFSISDRVYGRIFFLATGFHGAHVIAGGIFLTVVIIFSWINQKKYLIFTFAAWYWHFVDVVWLFLFVSVYWWRGGWMYSLEKNSDFVSRRYIIVVISYLEL